MIQHKLGLFHPDLLRLPKYTCQISLKFYQVHLSVTETCLSKVQNANPWGLQHRNGTWVAEQRTGLLLTPPVQSKKLPGPGECKLKCAVKCPEMQCVSPLCSAGQWKIRLCKYLMIFQMFLVTTNVA